jgi:hypothetical protein
VDVLAVALACAVLAAISGLIVLAGIRPSRRLPERASRSLRSPKIAESSTLSILSIWGRVPASELGTD